MIRNITSATNPFIKHLHALTTSKKARLESRSFIIEGWRAVDTMLSHESRQYILETLVVTPDWISDPRLPKHYDTALLPDHLFAKVSDVRNAQGILGVVRFTPQPFAIPEKGIFLLLDNLRDPGNLGTLIRSAVGAGLDGVLLYGDCVERFNPKVVRSTMGTFAFARIWHVGDDEIEQMRASGYDLCVTTGVGGENLYTASFSSKIVLIVGSEAHGICEVIMQSATRKISIPLSKECESLNAAIAGSICVFQVTRGLSNQGGVCNRKR